MEKFFRRMPLPVKLILIGLIPILFLIFLAFQNYKEKKEKLEILSNYIQGAKRGAVISRVIDELQLERRYSFGYVLKNDWRSELVVQRPKTDAAIADLAQYDNDQLKGVENYTFLNKLDSMRRAVDDNAVQPMGVMNYFTNALFRLNTLNFISSGNITYLNPVNKDLVSQKLLSEMITYLGIIRANLYYALYTRQNIQQQVEGVRGIYDIYKTYETELLIKSSDSVAKKYQNILANTEMKPVLEYVHNIFNEGKFDTASYDAEGWWDISAKGVDKLKAYQRVLMSRVQTGIEKVYDQEKTESDRMLVFLIIATALVIFLIAYTIKVIANMLNELKLSAQKIAAGATNIQFKVESNDVIGSLAQSILNIDENNKKLAQAAVAIGNKDFEVDVQPRSSEDLLGNAVVQMKADLQEFNRENEEKLWMHAGTAKINEAARGEKEIKTLSKDVLSALAEYLGGNVGLLYLCNNDLLKYTAGYAVANESSIPSEIKIGETQIGQAALKKQIVELHDTPDEFVKVKSAVGEAPSKHILIIPVLQNDNVEGVIEIGSLQPFDQNTHAFVHQIQAVIGIALHTAKNRARLQELFEETQAQAEELQVQHSELENINTELEAQTQKLQASEEELRVQQEELMQANQELEERSRLLEEKNQMIVERNLDIQKKAEELAASTKYKSEFLANMSHELRTPLNSILLLSRLLSENNAQNLSGEQVEYAQVIQSSGQGLLSLIDEILDLSKIEAGKMELEYANINVEEVANDMKALFAPVAKERGLDFIINIHNDVPKMIETDKMRLEQIIKNLISNALKFTSKGSVTLDVNSMPEQNAFVSFTVKDTGIGIPSEKQQLIFEAFQQADGSTRRKFGGTGLGLSISKELTKLLGGEIRVTSEPGKGSAFTVYIPKHKLTTNTTEDNEAVFKAPQPELELPVADDEEEVVAKTPERPKLTAPVIPDNIPDDRTKVAANDKVILIVEDDTSFAKALLNYTHSKGYKGIVAVRGDEGISLAQQYKPIGILLDIQLPVKDGWEVMEELKNNPATRHIPVHIMSSLEAKKESLKKGAIDFINKPVAFEQMQEVFKKIEHVLTKESKKVLIVEENSKHAKALSYFLETFNVNSQISNSVNEGLDALKKEDVDCVILDMGLPDQRAYETLESMKKNPDYEKVPIIIFTGKSLSKAEESRIKQYADSIVIKTAQSYQRILDEVSLFLHLVEENRQQVKGITKHRSLGALNEVLAGKKILVADDDVRNIFSLTKALELYDVNVVSAIDGKDALKQLNGHPDIDVVLMDIMMPEMDGYEAMQEIRKQPKFRNLPIIAVTAKAMTGDREKCIKAGASDYISKPVDIDQLLSLLRVWLYDKGL